MKSQQLLNAAQQALAEESLPLVHWVIHQYISTNENICGLGYEDLYLEGSLAPVSYTHLDVYKRQHIYSIQRRTCGEGAASDRKSPFRCR